MPKEILGLEISSGVIRYTYLKRKQKKAILFKSGKIFPSEANVTKEPAILAKTIQGIITQEYLSPHKTTLSLCGEDVLIHQINLPKMFEKELKEVIQTEVERTPKFAHHEFDFVYSLTKLNEQKWRALFCALSQKSLEVYTQGIRQAGLRLESLEVSPLNLLGLFYSRADKNKTEALLVLGEHLSYLLIFWQNECKLFSSLSAGKADLYLGHQGMNKSAFLGWTEEIRRICKSYQREFGMRLVERIWLVWDSEGTEELDTALAKELEIETLRPQPQDCGFELEDKKAVFNPIFLLSLAGPLNYLKKIKQKFDFPRFLQPLKLKKTVRKTGLFILLYIMFSGFLLGMLDVSFRGARKEILIKEREALQRIADLEKQTSQLHKERNDYLEVKNRLLLQAGYVRLLNRISWSEIFARIGEVLPEEVSLSSFEVSEAGGVKLDGSTFTIDKIGELIRKINSVSFLEEAQFGSLREREIEQKKIVDFALTTKLKADLDAKK